MMVAMVPFDWQAHDSYFIVAHLHSTLIGGMLFPVARQIAYISTFTTLVPGDIIVTGTPTGAGARFDPPIWLKPGDVVEVSATGLGTLRNTIADETL